MTDYRTRALVSIDGHPALHLTALPQDLSPGGRFHGTTSCGIARELVFEKPAGAALTADALDACGACLGREAGKPLGLGAD